MYRRIIVGFASIVTMTSFALTAPSTTRPEVAGSVARLIKEPRNETYRRAISDPAVKEEAWPLLERAVRARVPQQNGLGGIHWLMDNTDVLEAMASIDGPRATPLVLDLARNAPDAEMRRTAIDLLRYPLELESGQAREAVESGLKDHNGAVVLASLEYLAAHKDPGAAAAVFDILRHPEGREIPAWVQQDERDGPRNFLFRAAVPAVGNTGNAEAVDDLIAISREGIWQLQRDVIASISGCAAKDQDAARRGRAFGRLVELLDDESVYVRESAAAALAEMGDGRGAPVLARTLRAFQTHKKDSSDGPAPLLALRGLEKITGADYGASLGEDYWKLRAGESTAKATELEGRVAIVLADLHKRGIEPAEDAPLRTSLAAEEKVELEGRLKFLADPIDGQFVTFVEPQRTCWGSVTTRPAEGWLYHRQGAAVDRVVDADGLEVPIYEKLERVDLVAATERVVNEIESSQGMRDALDRGQYVDGFDNSFSSQRAAWLFRLGQEKLCAESLSLLRRRRAGPLIGPEVAPDVFFTFDAAINAYIVRDDDAAWGILERYRKHYPGVMEKDEKAMTLVAELERRRKEGSYVAHAAPATMPAQGDGWGHIEEGQPLKLPAGFDEWAGEKRAAWLVHELQEMDQRQMGQPGGVDVSADRRVKALVAIGDAAVPALIECIDHDERLTRSVQFWRDFSHDRNIIGVRECALSAVESILGTSVFEPASTGDSFTDRGEQTAHDTAAKIRAYWEKYGKVPLTKRMMGILTDPKSSRETAMSAASTLAFANAERRFGTQVWTGGVTTKPGPNPVIAEFSGPTVAEAILAFYDRSFGPNTKPIDGEDSYAARQLEGDRDSIASLLSSLHDERIVPAVVERYRGAKGGADVRRWASICNSLGDSGPTREVIAKLAAGQFELGAIDAKAEDVRREPGCAELQEWVKFLNDADVAEAERAFDAWADAKNPYHAAAAGIVRSLVIRGQGDWEERIAWSRHPAYVRLARFMLDDATPTGTTFSVDGNRLKQTYLNGWGSENLPEYLADPAVRRASAVERVCDVAGQAISNAIAGSPQVHVLFVDQEARLSRLREFVDAHISTLRAIPNGWAYQAGLDYGLEGPSLSVPLRLVGLDEPLAATWTPAGGREEKVLVLSRNPDAGGAKLCEILGRHVHKSVPESELQDVKPLK